VGIDLAKCAFALRVRTLAAAAGLLLAIILASCGPSAPPTLTSLAISPASPDLLVGGTQQFTATGSYSNGSTQNVTSSVVWASSNPQVAAISSTGLATMKQAGAVTFTAASGAVNATTPPLTVSPKLELVSVTPQNLTIPLGLSQQLTAKGVYGDGSSQTLTNSVSWSSSNSAVATVSTSGLATSVSTGTVTFTATEDSISGSTTATVGPAVSVSVTPTTATVSIGQSMQFTATVANTSDTSVTWSVDGTAGGNATVGTISSSGLYQAAPSPGTHTISAASTLDTSKSAKATVTDEYGGVLTYHNDVSRTGQNLNETTLTTANVNSSQFGKLFSYPVDGAIYGQPLYAGSVTISGQGVHNVVYVVTESDSVYAFDADGKTSTPLWHVNFTNAAAGITNVLASDVSDSAFPTGYIGITGTPVIDPLGGVLYVVAYTNESGQYVYRLHALNMTSGAEESGSPVEIQASTPGTGVENNGAGQVPFDPQMHLQRPALLLVNGVLYIGFGSHADTPPWHGWIMAYNSTTLQQTAAYDTTANSTGGAVWAGGGGPAADSSGNIYIATGNGTFDANTGGSDLGDSLLQLNPSTLAVNDWFTPFDEATLDAEDLDLGSGGLLLVPDQSGPNPHLLVASGKEGRIYLIDRDNMGHFNSTYDTQIVQEIYQELGGNYSTASYWQENVYFAAWNDTLKTFAFSNGLLSVTPVSQSSHVFGYVGATTSISANQTSNGIVWAIDWNLANSGGSGVLYAFDAADVANELYDTTQVASRDTLGAAAKFVVPTVFNGKVYVGGATELDVLGLLGQ
jgi:uncharacterized protein YjdB